MSSQQACAAALAAGACFPVSGVRVPTTGGGFQDWTLFIDYGDPAEPYFWKEVGGLPHQESQDFFDLDEAFAWIEDFR